LSAARLIGQSHSIKVLSEQAARQGRGNAVQPPLEVRTQVWYNPDLRSAYFMIPGVIGMVLYAIMAMLTATAVVRERERGTIEQLIVTPIRSWELIVGKVMPYVILGFFDLFEVLLIGHYWFSVPVRSNLLLVVGTAGLLLLSSLGIGLFASTIANTQQEALLTVFVTILPGVFISGFLFPLEAMPRFLQIVSYAIPLRYYLVIVRSLLLKGVGFAALQTEIISLAAFGLVIMTLASLRFRKRLD
jgi:ABC-2 type transport system permease protein